MATVHRKRIGIGGVEHYFHRVKLCLFFPNSSKPRLIGGRQFCGLGVSKRFGIALLNSHDRHKTYAFEGKVSQEAVLKDAKSMAYRCIPDNAASSMEVSEGVVRECAFAIKRFASEFDELGSCVGTLVIKSDTFDLEGVEPYLAVLSGVLSHLMLTQGLAIENVRV